jgi:hypothetical protein
MTAPLWQHSEHFTVSSEKLYAYGGLRYAVKVSPPE